MQEISRGFGSDNHSGVHPELLEAIQQVNTGHAPAYGIDNYSQNAKTILKEHFGSKADIFWTLTGTASNVLCIEALAQPYQSILCTEMSHLNVDECGAPERWTGSKLIACQSTNGKLTIDALKPHLIRGGDQHFSQPRVLSITQPTEVGTLYSLDEIKSLVEFAKSKGLLVHVDGARLSNAAVALNCSFSALTTELGIDAISLGGSKSGFLLGEAVIFPNGDPTGHFAFMRKQALQLPSKTRFIGAQFERFFGTSLWKDIAQKSLDMANYLKQAIEDIPGVTISYPVESNAVFAEIPKSWIKPARRKFFFYVWNPDKSQVRLMTSFDTSRNEIDALAALFRQLAERHA